MIENLKAGDVIQFDTIPLFHMVGNRPFGIGYDEWNKWFTNKPLTVKSIATYNGYSSFTVVSDKNYYYLPIQGARLVSRANPASVVNKSLNKDSKSMKFIPKSNKFTSNRVLAVTKDGPAARGGVQVGDTILKVGKYAVATNTKVSDIVQQLGKKGANRSITVKVSRNGKSRYCHVVLGRDNKTGKAILGIENNPKKVSVMAKPVTKDTTWAEHSKSIADSKASQAAGAKMFSEKKALEMALAKTKAEAGVAKAKHGEAVAELVNVKDAAKAAADEDNHFLKQARLEIEGVQALLADMKGADALLEAKALRAKLRAKNLNNLEATTDKVNAYLGKVVEQRAKETEIPAITTRRFGWKKAIAAASVLGTAVAGGAYAYVHFFTSLLG